MINEQDLAASEQSSQKEQLALSKPSAVLEQAELRAPKSSKIMDLVSDDELEDLMSDEAFVALKVEADVMEVEEKRGLKRRSEKAPEEEVEKSAKRQRRAPANSNGSAWKKLEDYWGSKQ